MTLARRVYKLLYIKFIKQSYLNNNGFVNIVLDVETYTESQGLGKVYCIGYSTLVRSILKVV